LSLHRRGLAKRKKGVSPGGSEWGGNPPLAEVLHLHRGVPFGGERITPRQLRSPTNMAARRKKEGGLGRLGGGKASIFSQGSLSVYWP